MTPSSAATPARILNEHSIRILVESFYGTVVHDPLLGPIFESRLGDRWDAHLNRMCDFWSTVLLGTRRFQGDPMGAHLKIPGLQPEHFERWITLFEEAAHGCLVPNLARDVVARSLRMRAAIERRMDNDRNDPDSHLRRLA